MAYAAIDEPRPLRLLNPRSVEEALEQHGGDPAAAYLAGGCDLVDQLKNQWRTYGRVINLKTVEGLAGERDEGDHVVVGSVTSLTRIAESEAMRRNYPALSIAAVRVATPQIRNFGTLGGNLLQDSRCAYYRGPWHCYRAGGIVCDALHGINTEHAIFGGDRCYTVTPSDTAPALVALDARARVASRDGVETVPAADLFLASAEDILHMHRLHDGRILTAIELPKDPPRRSHFIKYAMRNASDFALASIAVSFAEAENGTPRDWRVVLGAVATVPWRLRNVESLLDGERPSDAVIAEAAEVAVQDAEPLPYNAYKVALVRKLVREALGQVSS